MQRLPDPTQGGRVEARAHLGGVDEAGPVVDADVERAEVAARALRVGVATDDELLALLTLQLDPVRRPPADVPAPRALRDDALQPGALRGPVDVEPRLRHVVASPHRAARREEASEPRLPVEEREIPEVVALQGEAVEELGLHRHEVPFLRAGQKPFQHPLVRWRRPTHEPVLATVDSFDLELLSCLDAVSPAELRGEDDLPDHDGSRSEKARDHEPPLQCKKRWES